MKRQARKGEFDRQMMKLAFRLARKGLGRTFPNPLVGAVLVRERQIVGMGFHTCAGGDHAEVMALAEAGERARGSALYINLEPCCHHGRTPPCTQALISAGVTRVIAAMEDPNPLVAGKGLKELTAAGIQVETGLFQEEAERINEVFIKYITTGLPFVTLKAAVSLDGKIATHSGDSHWISGNFSRKYVHLLRSWSAAVMVGVGTVLQDNPRLDCRLLSRNIRGPLRVIVDSHGRTPPESNILKDQESSPTLIVVTEAASKESIRRLKTTGANVLVLPDKKRRVDLSTLARTLAADGITSILLEGGGTLNASAIQAGLVDQVQIFIAPKLIGGAAAPTFLEGTGIQELSSAWKLTAPTLQRFGEDLLLTAYLQKESELKRGGPGVYRNYSRNRHSDKD